MKIILTGTAGFIGSHTAKRLVDLGHTLIGIDNLDPYYSLALKEYNLSTLRDKRGFSFVELDICTPGAVATVASEFRPDVIIHLAAKAGVRASIEDPAVYTTTNIVGTQYVLDAARAAKVPKVMIASSSSVYGSTKSVPFVETDPVRTQVSPYAATKRAVEVLAKTYASVYHLPIQLFRFFTVYGPSGRPDMAPMIFTRAIDQGKPITVFGGTQTMRDYTYIDDIVTGLVAAIDRDDAFAIYNLGNNTPHKLHELIDGIGQLLGKQPQIQIDGRRVGDVEQTWADIRKAQRAFGYQPRYSLPEGLSVMIAWYQKHKELY